MNLIENLEKRKLITPPKWLYHGVCYLVTGGSVAYGTNKDNSDKDILGWCIPPIEHLFYQNEIYGFGKQKQRFEQYLQHGIEDKDKDCNYDITCFSISKFFNLAMECNPNVTELLFVPQDCVLVCNEIGQLVRDARHLFLTKNAYNKCRGYSFSQMHKMSSQNRTGKRKELYEEHGFDCYDEETTEFLTDNGWKKYEDINTEKLGTVNIKTGNIEFQEYSNRIRKMYTGKLYQLDVYLSRCLITEGHKVLVSLAHRNPGNNFNTKYESNKSHWELVPISEIVNKKYKNRVIRTGFHIRRCVESQMQEYNIDDDYLIVSGLYLSEGSIRFYTNKNNDKYPSQIALTQTENGKLEEFDNILEQTKIKYKKYEYKKENVYLFDKSLANKLFLDYGHGSKIKKLPNWCLKLSERQALLLWKAMWIGDGTPTPNGEVIYTSSINLANSIQAMLTCAGLLCSVRGPFRNEKNAVYGICDMYQVYKPNNQDKFRFMDFGQIKNKTEINDKNGVAVKVSDVKDRSVVCFEVSNKTLITRNNGRVAIHGNCKFGMNVVRLLLQCEQILVEGDLDLRKHSDYLKGIRNGLVSEAQIVEFFNLKEKELQKLYSESKLPWGPDEPKIRDLLLKCLEIHYGSLDKYVQRIDKYEVAVGKISEILNSL